MHKFNYCREGFTTLHPESPSLETGDEWQIRNRSPQIGRGVTGFTLVELLFVTFIMLLVVGGIIAIYIMSTTAWQEGGVQVTLQREASIAMEKMIRGIGGSDGIREASSASCPSSTAISYTSGIDGIERRFYQNSNVLYYDPDTSISGNEYSIADNLRTDLSANPPGLRFQVSNNIVTINLGMEGQVMNRKINVDLSTHVKLRN